MAWLSANAVAEISIIDNAGTTAVHRLKNRFISPPSFHLKNQFKGTVYNGTFSNPMMPSLQGAPALRHCEVRSTEAIFRACVVHEDCFVALLLAMTG
jgi:hypothetical protein